MAPPLNQTESNKKSIKDLETNTDTINRKLAFLFQENEKLKLTVNHNKVEIARLKTEVNKLRTRIK